MFWCHFFVICLSSSFSPKERSLLSVPVEAIPRISPEEIESNLKNAPDIETFVRKTYMQDGQGIPFQFSQRAGRNMLITTDLDLALKVFSNPNQYQNYLAPPSKSKSILLYNHLSTIALGCMNGPQWELYRGILHRSFNGFNRLDAFQQVANTLCENLRGRSAVEVVDMFQRVAMDCMGKSLLGLNISTITGESTMLDDYRRMFKQLGPLANSYDDVKIEQVKADIDKFKAHLIAQYDTKLPTDDDSMVTVLKRAEGEGAISRLEAIELVSSLFVIGQETIASTLASLSYHLAKHPEMQDRARREVAQGNTEFLKRCIKETLRLTPPSFARQPREVVNDDDEDLPKGTLINVMQMAMDLSSKYWQEPNRFNPDRFLDGEHNNLKAWMPFGYGKRGCPGQGFALKEIEEVMKVILARYSIHLPPDSPHQAKLLSNVHNFVTPKDLYLQFKPMVGISQVNHSIVAMMIGIMATLLYYFIHYQG